MEKNENEMDPHEIIYNHSILPFNGLNWLGKTCQELPGLRKFSRKFLDRDHSKIVFLTSKQASHWHQISRNSTPSSSLNSLKPSLR